jgi:hypothetical protein
MQGHRKGETRRRTNTAIANKGKGTAPAAHSQGAVASQDLTEGRAIRRKTQQENIAKKITSEVQGSCPVPDSQSGSLYPIKCSLRAAYV